MLIRKAKTIASVLGFVARARNASTLPIEDLVKIPFEYTFTAPIQVPWELASFATVARKINPKAFLEIGTHTGGAFFVLCQGCTPDALVISMDLPGAGEVYGRTPPYREFLVRSMKRPSQRYSRILGDSHSTEAFEKLKRVLSGKSIDLLFIDGDHSYEGVRTDFEMYSAFVRPGGLIGFHDIVKPANDPRNDVYKFWAGLKAARSGQEIIANPSPGWGGIGFAIA
jgi:predicted O-methyltransferase YrrM